MDTEKLQRQLLTRITDNYSDYRANLLLKDRQELIDGAGRIADTATVFQHMTDRSYTDQELEYLLKFQNPLEVVTEHCVVSRPVLYHRVPPHFQSAV